MKTFGIIVLSMFILVVVFTVTFGQLAPWSIGTYSDGSRTGLVNKISKKGIICKTYEGNILVGNGNNVQPEIFSFTVKNSDVADKIKTYEGKIATLEYSQKMLSSLCWGETGYEVINIK